MFNAKLGKAHNCWNDYTEKKKKISIVLEGALTRKKIVQGNLKPEV